MPLPSLIPRNFGRRSKLLLLLSTVQRALALHPLHGAHPRADDPAIPVVPRRGDLLPLQIDHPAAIRTLFAHGEHPHRWGLLVVLRYTRRSYAKSFL